MAATRSANAGPRNDCTNCRWNNRNATSSGPALNKVAAVMIDHSMPWSPEEKICSPTVNGLR